MKFEVNPTNKYEYNYREKLKENENGYTHIEFTVAPYDGYYRQNEMKFYTLSAELVKVHGHCVEFIPSDGLLYKLNEYSRKSKSSILQAVERAETLIESISKNLCEKHDLIVKE